MFTSSHRRSHEAVLPYNKGNYVGLQIARATTWGCPYITIGSNEKHFFEQVRAQA